MLGIRFAKPLAPIVIVAAAIWMPLAGTGATQAAPPAATIALPSLQITSTAPITTAIGITGSLTVTAPIATAPAGGGGLRNWLPSNSDETRKIVLAAMVGALIAAITFFAKRIGTALGRGTEWLWRRLRVERAIEGVYRKRLAQELRSIQLLTMPQAKNLETFYIPLRVVNWIEPDLKDSGTRQPEAPIDFQQALERFQRITVIGQPGAGKTTITSHTTAAIADGLHIVNRRYFPVYVQLRRLKSFLESDEYETKTLLDLAVEQIARHGFPKPEEFLKRQLQEGQCLLVLDGFDELADRTGIFQQRLANKVCDLLESVDGNNRFVLTSRAAGYMPSWFQRFQVLEMTELSPEQAKQFVTGWFGESHRGTGAALCSILDTSDRLRLLTTNPLMLAIVCFVYSTRQPEDEFLPKRRVDLYDRCVDALIRKWDESRGVKRDALFTAKEIEDVLCLVAYDALRVEKIDFTINDLLTAIRTHLPTVGRRQYEDEDFLHEVLEHTGLFKQKGHDTVGFLHLTFQEYLAARIIARKTVEGVEAKDVRGKLGEVLVNAINPAWFEPIALAAGIMRGRSELVGELHALQRQQPSKDLELLLALCLRDANLEEFPADEELLNRRDEILAVGTRLRRR